MPSKTALIVSACQPAAEQLALRLAALRWQVIAVDRYDTRLIRLAEHAPDRIDPLPMALNSRDNIVRLGQEWGDERIDLLAQFQPLAMPSQITLAVQTVMLMTDVLTPGLRAAQGLNLVALPRSRNARDPLSQAAEGAHARALRALSLRHETARFRNVGLLATKTRGAAMAEAAEKLATGAQRADNGTVHGI